MPSLRRVAHRRRGNRGSIDDGSGEVTDSRAALINGLFAGLTPARPFGRPPLPAALLVENVVV